MEGEKTNVGRTSGKTAGAIARARQALAGNTAGGNTGGTPGPSSGDSGKGSGGVSGNQETGINEPSGRLDDVSGGGGGSENPSGGSKGVDARSRANERRTSLRDSRHGKSGIGSNGESGSNESGLAAGTSDTAGSNPNSTEEENETLLSFPPEAYFKDGKLKKSWAEKLSGGNKTPEAKPSALVKKKGISFLGDKELFSQVSEGIQYLFKAMDLAADFGLGVSDVWELDEDEAAVFARILLKRADKGDKKAIKTIATISENMDLVQAAMIVIPRVGVTIKEVRDNGIHPKTTKARGRKTPNQDPGINPAGI